MINCKLCHSSDVIQIHDKLYSKDSGAVYRCGACDVVFIDPFMSDEESRLFYQNYNDYLVRRGVNVTADPQEDYRVRGPSIQERFENLRGFFAKKSAVCEVGSASGGFLELLHKELDIDTCAVEQNEVNLAFSSKFYKWGYNDIEGMPDDLKFDSICAFHVLEHINRPQDFLENLRKHLKPNGQIVIEVPGADDALLSLYRSKPYADWMYIPIHPFWYSATASITDIKDNYNSLDAELGEFNRNPQSAEEGAGG